MTNETRVSIKPYKQGDFEPLLEAAQGDAHTVVSPTHVLWQDGKPVGYLSIASVPMVLSWLHTEKVKIRETLNAQMLCENLCAQMGATLMCVPCPDGSPFHALMLKEGYVDMGKWSLMLKQI